jgi:hypothetical protein
MQKKGTQSEPPRATQPHPDAFAPHAASCIEHFDHKNQFLSSKTSNYWLSVIRSVARAGNLRSSQHREAPAPAPHESRSRPHKTKHAYVLWPPRCAPARRTGTAPCCLLQSCTPRMRIRKVLLSPAQPDQSSCVTAKNCTPLPHTLAWHPQAKRAFLQHDQLVALQQGPSIRSAKACAQQMRK